MSPASPNEKVFVCPSDSTYQAHVGHAFTSYTFNGYETAADSIRGIVYLLSQRTHSGTESDSPLLRLDMLKINGTARVAQFEGEG